MNDQTSLKQHKITILDKHDFLDGSWIGSGIVTGGQNVEQTIGFRIVDKNGAVIVWTDMSRENALILAGTLIKACHAYDELLKEGVDPRKEPETKVVG